LRSRRQLGPGRHDERDVARQHAGAQKYGGHLARLVVAAVVTAGFLFLTHFGTPGLEDEPGAAPVTTSPPTIVSGPDAPAQAIVLKALDAERVYYVDHVEFAAGAGAELAELRKAEPGLVWGRDAIVVVPASEGEHSLVVVVRAASSTGRVFCGAEVATPQDAGTWYAATVNAPCPPVARGMPGWSTDRTIGWL
jgi:hypothetical protein